MPSGHPTVRRQDYPPIMSLRSEVEIAADTLAALIAATIVARNPIVVAQSCKAAGIKIGDLKDAWWRLEEQRDTRPRNHRVSNPPKTIRRRPVRTPPGGAA